MQRIRSVAKGLVMGRRVAWILGILVVAAVGAGLWWHFRSAPSPTQWQGYAEADFVKVGPTQAGLLTEVNVGRGDRVAAGQPLFAQDATFDRAARDQAARQLRQAQDQLANLEAASKPTEIKQAQANLTDARATLVRTKADLDRAEALVRTGAGTTQTLNQRQADYRSAVAKVAALEAALAQAQAPIGRPTEIKAQQAAVAAAKAALKMAQWRLAQRSVTAPVASKVADVLALPGETVSAGAPVVSLLPPGNIFVRFFVPETDLSAIHLGERMALLCDGCRPGFYGTVSFISPQAEYTPPVIYSEETRAKLVYMIEARPPPAQAALLNPGQPVTVRPVERSVTP
jgi:HlyD family secretion protein